MTVNPALCDGFYASLTLLKAMALLPQKKLCVSFQPFRAAIMLHSTMFMKFVRWKLVTKVQIKTIGTLFDHSLSNRAYVRCIFWVACGIAL